MKSADRTNRWMVMLLCVAALVLAACAGGSANENEQASTTQNETSDSTVGGEENPDASPSDTTLTVAIPGDIDNFDGHVNRLIAFEYAIRSTVFNKLVTYNETLDLVPDLAEFSVNDAATEFTFELQPDVVFHNGEELNAEVVISNLERASEVDSTLALPLRYIGNMTALDELTVLVELTEPYSPFLSGLTRIPILAPESFESAESEPVGTGPFRFVSWSANEQIVLERNDNYWGTPAMVSQLVLRPISDPQVAYTNMRAGEVDIIVDAPLSLTTQIDDAASDEASVFRPDSSNTHVIIEMMGNSGVLADERIRQALAYALDRESVRTIAYGGLGEIQSSPLPRSSFAYSEPTSYEYDLEKAAELFAEAGAEDLVVQLEVPAGFPDGEHLGRIWQQSLAEIGITLNVEVSELSVWLDRFTSHSYDMTWNISPLPPEPHGFFSTQLGPHLDDQYQAPHVTELIAKGLATSDENERKEIYGDLQEIVVEEVPILTVQSKPLASVVREGVTGYWLNPMGWAWFAETQVSS